MAQTIKLKRSATAGNIPTSSDLALGEIAINTADGAVYIKKGNDDIIAVADNDILHIDTTNGRVGIGLTNPGAKLQVDGAIVSEGGSFASVQETVTDAGLVFQKNDFIYSDDNNYLRRIIGHTSTGSIEIGQGGTSLISDIILKPGTSGNIRFFGSGSEDVRIDSSGNVLVGTTDTSLYNNVSGEGVLIAPDHIQIARDSDTTAVFNRQGTDGQVITFNKSGSTVGSIGTVGGDATIGTGDTGLRFRDEFDAIQPHNITTNGTNDDVISIGKTGARFKDLYLSGTANVGGLNINSAYTFPTADGSANQVLATDGSGALSFVNAASGGSTDSITDADGDTKIQVEESADEDIIRFDVAGTEVLQLTSDGLVLSTTDVEANEFIGDLRGAVLFKAQAGENVTKGDVVYISGISGNTTVVSKADADDASKMPAFGIVAATTTSGQPVDIYTQGILGSLDTSAYSEGDELFVSTTAGALTNTPPTGETAAIQKIAKVTRSNASAGSIFITGAGRSNAVPNLDEDQFFLGNASNQAVATDFSDAVEALSINNVVEDTTPQLGGDLASNGNDILFADSDKAIFGTGSDLQIYHDGSNSYIDEVGTGNLLINANNLRLRDTSGNPYFLGNNGAEVRLYHNGSTKLQTTSTGIDVTGNIVADGGTIDGTFIVDGGVGVNSTGVLHVRQSGDGEGSGIAITSSNATSHRIWKNASGVLNIGSSSNTNAFQQDLTGNITIEGTINSGAITSTGEVEATALDINGNGDISGNLILGGYLAGPATFTIDPAAVGDNTGTVVIAGNLQVDGTTTTINSTTLTVDDKNITLASGSANAAAANGAGLTVDCGSDTDATFTYDGTNDEWDFNKPLNVTGAITNTGLIDNNYTGTGVHTLQNSTTNGTVLNLTTTGDSRVLTLQSDHIYSNGNFYLGNNSYSTNYRGSAHNFDTGDLTIPNKIIHSGDTDTYLHFAAADDFRIVVGNSTRAAFNTSKIHFNQEGINQDFQVEGDTDTSLLYVDGSADNVGIGTSSPSQSKLVVDGTISIPRSEGFQYLESISGGFRAGIFSTNTNDTGVGFNSLRFFVNADSTNPAMVIGGSTNDKNVGIGTDSPSEKLHTQGSTNGILGNKIENTNSGTSARADLVLSGDANDVRLIATSSTYIGVSSWTDAGVLSTGSTTSGGLIFNAQSGGIKLQTSATERMRIDSSGNVGIGTTSPAQKLSVSGASGSARFSLERSNANTTGGVGSIQWNALDGHAVAGVAALGDGNDEGAHLIFNTTSAASSSDFYVSTTERLRITSSGNVGIGTSSPSTLLELNTGSFEAMKIRRGTSGTDASVITFAQGDGTSVGHVGGVSSGGLQFRTGSGSGTEKMRIDSSGNVGIGTTSPDSKLVISEGASATGLEINPLDANERIDIYGFDRGSNVYRDLRFIADEFRVETGTSSASERMRIDSSGNLLVGKTSADNGATAGIELSGSIDKVSLTRDGSSALALNRLTSDGTLLEFKKDGTTVGSIGSLSGVVTEIVLDPRTNGASLTGGTNKISPGNQSGALDAHLDLGSINNRFKDLYLSGTLTNDGTGGISIDTSGNVGIGTTSPSELLEVSKSTDGATIRISSTQNDSAHSTTTPFGILEFYSSDSSGAGAGVRGSIKSFPASTTGGAADLVFSTSNSTTNDVEMMRITDGGNVGIGTDDPDALLDIEKAASGTSFVPYLQLGQTYTVANSKYGIDFKNTEYSWNQGRISVERQGSAANFDMILSSAGGGSLVEGIRIDHAGNVGIGTTNPQTKLHVEGLLRITESSNTAFYEGASVRVFGSGQEYGFRDSGGTTKASISMTGNSYFNGGNVGIGTTSPAGALHLRDTTPHLYIQSDDGQSGKLLFGDATDNSRGGLEYTSSDSLIFLTNNLATALTLNSSGNATFAGTITSNDGLYATGIWANNNAPATDDAIYSGYGIIGNRTNYYITNANASGQIVMGISGGHNANPKLTIGASSATFSVPLTATSFSDGTISGITFIDEDSFATNSATRIPTQQSVKSYVDTQVAGIVDSAPGTLDTLNELAAALGDDANFSTTVTNSIATKMPLAGGSFTGDVTFGTGADFGSGVASSTTDLSRHLALWSTSYGFNITSNNINLVSNGTNTLSSTSSTLTSKVNHDFSAGIDVTGNITVTGTVDGRDIATDGTKLDGIAANANNYSFPYTVSVSASNNTVVQRHSSGYIYANFFNGTGTFNTTGNTSGMALFTGTNGNDTFGRSYTAAAARALLNVENGATADQTAAEILSALLTVDGPGSGLNADLLDGISSASFLRSDADDTYTGNLTVTGNINQTGALTATSKSFDIEHPTKEGMRLHHGVLEGPEHAVYIRGKSNSYIIELPDYWEGLVHEDTITVQLTPIGGQNNMWIENIEDNKVYINCEREMKQYFYFIQAERKDVERFEVEYGNSI